VTGHAGTVLSSARRARQLTQWEAARAAGISSSYLSKLETGTEPVPPGAAARLAPVLGLKAADLTRAPRPQRASRAVAPSPAVSARSFRDIPVTCPCDWRMTFEDRRPSGWELAGAKAACPHHGNGGTR
jgi:transcriptional regulator with XRE-family HTH domain